MISALAVPLPRPAFLRRVLEVLLPAGFFLCPIAALTAEESLFHFHHEGVLGTSLDLQVMAADEKQAGIVEAAVLGEIERLRKLLSSYDPESELSRLNAATGPMVCSRELIDVLAGYDSLGAKSGGAYSGQLGALIELWRAAEKSGVAPDAAALRPVVAALREPGWKLDRASRTVARRTAGPLNVDSLGKGYILGKAAAVAKAKGAKAFLLNIGGDLFASGKEWDIGVADPGNSADNALPLTRLRLADRAISTSAAYERGFTIGGQRYSHILDPRTGRPAEGVASATVVASDNVVANALATTLCVLKPEEGLALAQSIPDTACLIIAADGHQHRSPNFVLLENGLKAGTEAKMKAGGWPDGYQVTLTLTLKKPSGGRKIKRPYVAVWIEDAEGKRVRTVAVWGKQRKYLPDLRAWWKVARDEAAWAESITRATRPAGKHSIAWDGENDQGQPLPPGTYTVVLEVNREHGTYAMKQGTIECGASPARGTIPSAAEFEEAPIVYGPPTP
jgi:thiamine biosynthesis lipoprotein